MDASLSRWSTIEQKILDLQKYDSIPNLLQQDMKLIKHKVYSMNAKVEQLAREWSSRGRG